MDKYDLCIYGHMTIDHIFDNFKEKHTLGAMANVWHALMKLNTNLKIKLNPISIGEAIILINKKNTQRVGRGELNIQTRSPEIVNASWNHIMYLNQLPDISFLDKIQGTISADITAGDIQSIIPYLNKIDYLFISDEDLFMNVNELGKKVKGHVILHYTSGSFVTNGKKSFEKKTKVVENIDVLGAGDIFAACFINACIKSMPIEKAVEYAHQKTTDILIGKKSNEN
jgi:hypothetical protein